MPLRISPFSCLNTAERCFYRHRSLPRLTFRAQSQFPRFPGGGGHRPRYNRFQRAQQIQDLWTTSQNFRYGVFAVGAGGVVFVAYNIEQVTISGRRRFNCVPESYERQSANGTYQLVMRQYGNKILPPQHPDSRMVQRVLDRLIPASGLGHEGWEVKVIGDREQKNAFVLPGGKVFVFSGILPICGDEDGLAAVLGHEIAHNVAHHTGEKISQMAYILPLVAIITFAFDTSAQLASLILDFAVQRPGSRKMETEADLLGLLMMAKSCYDPAGALAFWKRMAQAEKSAPPQFVSTHPSSASRIQAIEKWLPQAQDARAASDCGRTIGYADDFARVFQTTPIRGQPSRRPSPIREIPRRDSDDDDFW